METMSVAAAIKAHIREFNSSHACKACGSHARVCLSWSPSGVACAGCEIGGSSVARVKFKEIRLNRAKRKKQNKFWVIPVVYRGLNTVK